MPANPEKRKLRDVCKLINGRAYSKDELLAEGKYPVLRVGNFFTNNNWYHSDLELPAEKYCEAGDLLYAWSASFGPRIWVGPKVIFHYHIWKVIPNRSLVDQRFLYYFFMWDTEQIKLDQGAGTTMIHVAKGSMEDREIVCPSLAQQQRIVAILDEAFAGIATAKANAERNLQNAQAISEAYLRSIFDERGGEWSSVTLGEIADFRNGINFTKSSKGERIRILGVKDFQSNYWAPESNLDSVTVDGSLAEHDYLQTNDLVFVRSNGNPALIGRCVLIGDLSERTTHSGFTIRARLTTNAIVPTYLCHFLKSSVIRQEMIDGGNGANIKSLNQGTLARLSIPYPSASEQERIVSQLEEVLDQSQQAQSIYTRKLTALDDLRQSLLHQASSGQL